jgi:phage terminase Nu1 subunit (DNA packaging protein)
MHAYPVSISELEKARLAAKAAKAQKVENWQKLLEMVTTELATFPEDVAKAYEPALKVLKELISENSA